MKWQGVVDSSGVQLCENWSKNTCITRCSCRIVSRGTAFLVAIVVGAFIVAVNISTPYCAVEVVAVVLPYVANIYGCCVALHKSMSCLLNKYITAGTNRRSKVCIRRPIVACEDIAPAAPIPSVAALLPNPPVSMFISGPVMADEPSSFPANPLAKPSTPLYRLFNHTERTLSAPK